MSEHPIQEVGGHKHRRHESGGLAELWFEGLQAGDTVLLDTESGSSYQLHIKANENPDKTVATIERNNDQDIAGDDTTSWEQIEAETIFDLRGSCERMLTGVGSGLQAVGGMDGHFTVGKRAWLGTEVDGEDKSLITSKITSINIISAV